MIAWVCALAVADAGSVKIPLGTYGMAEIARRLSVGANVVSADNRLGERAALISLPDEPWQDACDAICEAMGLKLERLEKRERDDHDQWRLVQDPALEAQFASFRKTLLGTLQAQIEEQRTGATDELAHDSGLSADDCGKKREEALANVRELNRQLGFKPDDVDLKKRMCRAEGGALALMGLSNTPGSLCSLELIRDQQPLAEFAQIPNSWTAVPTGGLDAEQLKKAVGGDPTITLANCPQAYVGYHLLRTDDYVSLATDVRLEPGNGVERGLAPSLTGTVAASGTAKVWDALFGEPKDGDWQDGVLNKGGSLYAGGLWDSSLEFGKTPESRAELTAFGPDACCSKVVEGWAAQTGQPVVMELSPDSDLAGRGGAAGAKTVDAIIEHGPWRASRVGKITVFRSLMRFLDEASPYPVESTIELARALDKGQGHLARQVDLDGYYGDERKQGLTWLPLGMIAPVDYRGTPVFEIDSGIVAFSAYEMATDYAPLPRPDAGGVSEVPFSRYAPTALDQFTLEIRQLACGLMTYAPWFRKELRDGTMEVQKQDDGSVEVTYTSRSISMHLSPSTFWPAN